jgi:phospholipid/cholesterol/gamma-HCH transport system permease protein
LYNLIPKWLQKILLEIWGLYDFSEKFLKELLKPPYEIREVIRQFYEIGNKSFPLVGVTGFIIGFVLALQAVPTLKPFGATSLIPAMISISLVREIGPVIIGLICAGKIGSGIGAELGSMKVTEQIDAMEVSACNPFKYLVTTRVIAATFMIPLLIIYADALASFGGYLALNIQSDISIKFYYSQIFNSMAFGDLVPPTIKTFFFGYAIGMVGCFKGYNADRGTESVGIAANTAVVVASLMVIFLDMIAVQISNIIF